MPKMIKPVPIAPVIKKNTRIIFVLDRSGSMDKIKHDTVGGYNTYVSDQRGGEGHTRFSLVQFDDQYEPDPQVTNLDISLVPTMVVYTHPDSDPTTTKFHPRGWTALYDAVGYTLARALAEPEDPTEETIFAILTDGDENRSREYTYEAVQTLMAEAQDKRRWKVLFIGANINAKAVAATMGIKASNSFEYSATGKGIGDAMKTASLGTTVLRAASRGVDFASLGSAYSFGAAAAVSGEVDMTAVYNSVTAGDKTLEARLEEFKKKKVDPSVGSPTGNTTT